MIILEEQTQKNIKFKIKRFKDSNKHRRFIRKKKRKINYKEIRGIGRLLN